MTALEAIEYSIGAAYMLWVAFLAVMNLQRAKDAGTLGPMTLALGMPLIICAYMLDIAVNVTLASVLLLEAPREWTLSERLVRLARGPQGYRRTCARWILSNLLNTFDPTGRHGF